MPVQQPVELGSITTRQPCCLRHIALRDLQNPREARRAFEREYLARILKITQGNVTQAARLAGRNRTEFYRLLDRHALQPAMFKMSPPSDNEIVESSTASRARPG